jgi:hypothetical protein
MINFLVERNSASVLHCCFVDVEGQRSLVIAHFRCDRWVHVEISASDLEKDLILGDELVV